MTTGFCFNGGHPLVDPVWSDVQGCVVCGPGTECAEEFAELEGGDGVTVLIDFEAGTFSYAPVTDPAIVDLERRLVES